MTFGQTLRTARVGQGLALETLAERTRIRVDYLRALESEQLDALPERPLTRSFLQRYARELRLDAAPLLAELDELLPVQESARRGVTAEPSVRPSAGVNPLLGALVTLGLVALLAGLYLIGGKLLGQREAKVEVPPATSTPVIPQQVTVPLSISSLPTGAKVLLDNRELGYTPIRSFPVEARAGAVLRVEYGDRMPFQQTLDLRRGRNLQVRLQPSGQAPSVMTDLASGQVQASQPVEVPSTRTLQAMSKGVKLSLSGDSWLRVTDREGKVLYEGILSAGDEREFPNGVSIRAGNPGVVRVSVDGEAASVMGELGKPLTRNY